MSQEEIIKQGIILRRKQTMMEAVTAGKASLRSLVNEAVYAKAKSIEEIDTDSLKTHLDNLIRKKEEILKLTAEIRELEY